MGMCVLDEVPMGFGGGSGDDPSFMAAMIRLVKGSDPTRPVLMPQRIDEFLPPEIDILAPHYRPPSALDQLAAHSSRPIITTEYTHAYAEDGFGGLSAVSIPALRLSFRAAFP